MNSVVSDITNSGQGTSDSMEGAASLIIHDEDETAVRKVIEDAFNTPLNPPNHWNECLQKAQSVAQHLRDVEKAPHLPPEARPSRIILDKMEGKLPTPAQLDVLNKAYSKAHSKGETPDQPELVQDKAMPMEVDNGEPKEGSSQQESSPLLEYIPSPIATSTPQPVPAPEIIAPDPIESLSVDEYDPTKVKPVSEPGKQPYDPTKPLQAYESTDEDMPDEVELVIKDKDKVFDYEAGDRKKELRLRMQKEAALASKQLESDNEAPQGNHTPSSSASSSPKVVAERSPEIRVVEERSGRSGRIPKLPKHAFNARAEVDKGKSRSRSEHRRSEPSRRRDWSRSKSPDYKRSRPSTSKGRNDLVHRTPAKHHETAVRSDFNVTLRSLLGFIRPGFEKGLALLPPLKPQDRTSMQGHPTFVQGSLPFPPRPKVTSGIYDYIEAGFNVPTYLAMMSSYLVREGFKMDEILFNHLKAEVKLRVDKFIPTWWRDNLQLDRVRCCFVCGKEDHSRNSCPKKHMLSKDNYCAFCLNAKDKDRPGKPTHRPVMHSVTTCPDLHSFCYACEAFGHQLRRPCPIDDEEREEYQTRWEAFKGMGCGTQQAMFHYSEDRRTLYDQVEEIFGKEYFELLSWGKTSKHLHVRIFYKEYKDESLRAAKERATAAETLIRETEQDIDDMQPLEIMSEEYRTEARRKIVQELQNAQFSEDQIKFLTEKFSEFEKQTASMVQIACREMFRQHLTRFEKKIRQLGESLLDEFRQHQERTKRWEAKAHAFEFAALQWKKDYEELHEEMDQVQLMVLKHDDTVEGFHSALRADTTSAFTLRKEMKEFQATMRQDFNKLKEEMLKREQRDQGKIEDLRGELARREQETVLAHRLRETTSTSTPATTNSKAEKKSLEAASNLFGVPMDKQDESSW